MKMKNRIDELTFYAGQHYGKEVMVQKHYTNGTLVIDRIDSEKKLNDTIEEFVGKIFETGK